jgi:hypothetical protein
MAKTIKMKVAFKAPKKKSYPVKQMKMGVKVEAEHTGNKKARKNIAKNHLDEIPDYYTRLGKMEKQAKKGKKGKR